MNIPRPRAGGERIIYVTNYDQCQCPICKCSDDQRVLSDVSGALGRLQSCSSERSSHQSFSTESAAAVVLKHSLPQKQYDHKRSGCIRSPQRIPTLNQSIWKRDLLQGLHLMSILTTPIRLCQASPGTVCIQSNFLLLQNLCHNGSR